MANEMCKSKIIHVFVENGHGYKMGRSYFWQNTLVMRRQSADS